MVQERSARRQLQAMGGVFERTVMEGVVQITAVVEEKIKKMPKAEQEKALSDMAASLQPACRRAKTRASTRRWIQCMPASAGRVPV